MNKLVHYFIPHPQTHEKAHLLSWHFLIIYILLFILLRVSIDLVNLYRPGVLGISSNIAVEQIIQDTNRERQKTGLPLLAENSALSQAARLKAQNMFEENYWAHFSPSGKDPWGFITRSGYKFSYAGENLARNFYNSEDVVKAWMDSPSHKDNILNSHYQDIGIAVVEGNLGGQKTTLVVQMFGKSYEPVASMPPQVNVGGQKIALSPSELNSIQPVLVESKRKIPSLSIKPVLDPFALTRVVGIFLVSLVALLVAIDFIMLKRRRVFRLSSHHFAHLSFLAIASMSIILSRAGEIL